MNPPATELTDALRGASPGRALDLACGSGRHAIWLHDQGWQVTAVDQTIETIPDVTCIRADLEHHQFPIEPQTWDLIVCWLYWQEDLLPAIAAGLKPGAAVALAGKLTGRFATSLARYRSAFPYWTELNSGEDAHKVFFIALRNP